MLVKLGDVIELNPKESIRNGEIARKIGMSDLKEFKRDISSFSYEKYSGGTKFRNNDVLLARITPCLENGKTALVNILNNDEVAFGSTEYFVLRPKIGLIIPDYLYYLVVTNNFREVAIKSMTGTSGRQRVQKTAILSFKFELPSLIEQKKAVKLLKLIDDKLYLNNNINANLLELAYLSYKQLIDRTNFEGILSDIAMITMGQSPKSSTYNDQKIGMPLLNGATDFRNNIAPAKWTTDPKKIAYAGAYIFGVRATIGLTTKISSDYAIGRGTGMAIPMDPIYDEFLYFVLNDLFHHFSQVGTGSIYINISKKEFDSFKIKLPDRKDIYKFHNQYSAVLNHVYLNDKENMALSQLKESLLKKLLSH